MPARYLRVASRAVMRGPVQADPRIRQTAEWLTTNQLNESSRFRWLGLSLFVFLTVSSVAIALTSSPCWWLDAVAMFSLYAFFLILSIHLKRHVEILKPETSE